MIALSGKSDHVLMEFNLKNESVIIHENYKVKRFKYSKVDFEKLRKYFVAMDWKDFEDVEDVQEKWDEFIRIYNSAVEKFVLKGGARCRMGKEWFNTKCRG